MDGQQLPSESALEQLPRRAIVAFAARCARKVLPVFEQSWPDAPAKYLKALAEAVHVAEAVGSAGLIAGADDIDETARARRARRAADAAAVAATAARAPRAADAAAAARAAADAAARARDRRTAAASAYAAFDAAHTAAARATDSIPRLDILNDWVKIRVAAVSWRKDVSVQPSFFDSLTDPVELANSAGDTRQHSVVALELALEFSGDASDDEIARATELIVTATDALHRAQGGHGLVLDSLQAEQPAAAEVTR